MTSDSVPGYTNYETFHVAMFLSNNQVPFTHCLRLARIALAECNAPNVRLAEWLVSNVTDWLRTDERENACEGDSDTLAHSLLMAALDRVNWCEIAEEWLSTAREEKG